MGNFWCRSDDSTETGSQGENHNHNHNATSTKTGQAGKVNQVEERKVRLNHDFYGYESIRKTAKISGKDVKFFKMVVYNSFWFVCDDLVFLVPILLASGCSISQGARKQQHR